jgi:hypothetical protein
VPYLLNPISIYKGFGGTVEHRVYKFRDFYFYMIKNIAPVLTLGGNRIVLPGLPDRRETTDRPRAELALFTGHGRSECEAEGRMIKSIHEYLGQRGYKDFSQDAIHLDALRGRVEATCLAFLIEEPIEDYLAVQNKPARTIMEELLAKGAIRPSL